MDFDKDVAIEVAGGTSFVCAMCHRYWRGKEIREQGQKIRAVVVGQRCTAQENCGSPIVGDVFHLYEGPLTNFEKYCFVCGSPARYGIKVRELLRKIGVCENHVKIMEEVKGARNES